MKTIIYGYIPYIFCSVFCPKSPKRKYYKFFKDNGYTRFPYPFAKKYAEAPFAIKYDEEKQLRYILHTGEKRLYFPNSQSEDKIRRTYISLTTEQDKDSPHRYVDSIEELRGKTILDIGAAEGIISLDAVEVADFIYLFECDPKWIEALNATFEPWKDKVRIIEKYIGNTNNETTQTLDNFFKDKPKENLFIKMDIEGNEPMALEGSKNLFAEGKGLQFAVCTYHNKNDLKIISKILDSYNCTYSAREGLFFVKHSLRTCLLRGYK